MSGYFASRRPPRQVPVTAHEGTRAAFLDRRTAKGEAAALGGAARDLFLAGAYDLIADSRTLYAAAEKVVRDGGPARGADGVGPADLDRHAVKSLVAELHAALTTREYQPGPTRNCEIPKPAGGTRTLTILTAADRVVQRAVVDVLTPYIDPQLAPTTFGGRPDRSVADAIAALAAHVARTGNSVLVTADVAKAFDNVPLDRLAAELRERFEEPRLVALLDTIARGRNTTGVGVAQGGATSMLFLNLLLDTAVDKPWRERHPDRPLFRWVDDLFTSAADVEEGKNLLAELHPLVGSVGLSLKPTAAVTDLRTGGVEVLGFHLGIDTDDNLTARIADSSYHQLEEHLEQAHRDDNPGTRARMTTLAWMAAQGPTHANENHDRVAERLRKTLTDHDFPGIVTPEELLRVWEKAGTRYQAELKAARGTNDLNHHKDGAEQSGKTAAASPARTRATIMPTIGDNPASSTHRKLDHSESSTPELRAVSSRRNERDPIGKPHTRHARCGGGSIRRYGSPIGRRQRRIGRPVAARTGSAARPRIAPPARTWCRGPPRRPGETALRHAGSARARPPHGGKRVPVVPATGSSPSGSTTRGVVGAEGIDPAVVDEPGQ